ncbi:MAG: hypothetical protein ACM3SQ_15710 [Betaproteobacteria bacterium]
MKRWVLVGALVGALGVTGAYAHANASQSTSQPAMKTVPAAQESNPAKVPATKMRLATVHIPRKVNADDQPLKAGTYVVQLTGEALEPAPGQTPDLEQWVEFVQGGKVRGKAVASIVPADQIKEVAKTPPSRPPKAGTAKVELLKGNDYVRVWINKGGVNYLIHLPVASAS